MGSDVVWVVSSITKTIRGVSYPRMAPAILTHVMVKEEKPIVVRVRYAGYPMVYLSLVFQVYSILYFLIGLEYYFWRCGNFFPRNAYFLKFI